MTSRLDPTELRYRYESWNTDEIVGLLRRGGLEAEAEQIAREILASRGNPVEPSPASSEAETKVVSGLELARQLWKSRLVKTCQLIFILVAWLPTQLALKKSGMQLGALWMGVLAVAIGYGGYRVGYAITKAICADDQTTYEQKRRSVWLTIGGSVAAWFIAVAIISALVGPAL